MTNLPPILILPLALAACAPAPAPPPAAVRDPDPRTMQRAAPLPPLRADAIGNPAMVESYGQCRLAYADLGDRHGGLVDYVAATRGAKTRQTP